MVQKPVFEDLSSYQEESNPNWARNITEGETEKKFIVKLY